MKKLYDKSPILYGVLYGQILLVLLVLFEYFLISTGISNCGTVVDFYIRIVFGIFLSAIYLYAENIVLCMVLHGVWDIFIRIPENFCENISKGFILDFIYTAQDILELGVFPIVAILICVKYKPMPKNIQDNECTD